MIGKYKKERIIFENWKKRLKKYRGNIGGNIEKIFFNAYRGNFFFNQSNTHNNTTQHTHQYIYIYIPIIILPLTRNDGNFLKPHNCAVSNGIKREEEKNFSQKLGGKT